MDIRKVLWRFLARLKGKVPCAKCGKHVSWDEFMVNNATCEGCFDQSWAEYMREVDKEIPQWTPFDHVGIGWVDDCLDSSLAVVVNGKMVYQGHGYEAFQAILERLKHAGGLNIQIGIGPNPNVQNF